jgi:uncharacterized membrane protein YbhN (UPF0104 family)
MKLQPPVFPGLPGGPVTGRHGPARSWRERGRRLLPYLIGGVMFAVAVWVLHSTLARFHLGDLRDELAGLSARQLGLAVLFTFLSFVALVGYEWSALGMIGKRLPLRQLALASFATQSIAHSTGFAFLIGATLRYNFYADKGLGIGDVAKVQVLFTATFTLGVATLAGSVVALEPWRLAAATGVPGPVWRVAAATGLLLVIAYVVWGALFHRPMRWRGREFTLPSPGATLTQIFFGVADLMAVAAALHVLLPAELGLTYPEVLTVFMASIVVGLMSHVPGSLGVFESAVILLIQPTEAQTLPLIGALLAFRAVYYLLPLICGVAVLALSEMHRWRGLLARLTDRFRLDLGPGTPQLAAGLSFVAGLVLLVAAMTPGAPEAAVGAARASSAPPQGWDLPELTRILQVAAGVALLVLARGLAQRIAAAWRWVMSFLLIAVLACLAAGEPALLDLFLLACAALLFACRADFPRGGDGPLWRLPAWPIMLVMTVASSLWLLLGRV